MSKRFDSDAAIAASIRRDSLREAEANGAWVIRRRKILRIPSRVEKETAKRVSGSQTCFHDLSYTMPCTRCRRSKKDAESECARIVHLIKNQ